VSPREPRELSWEVDGLVLRGLGWGSPGERPVLALHATYQIWDDLPQIRSVLEALGWQRCALLGHSRGAIIATLLASACPELITHLVLLDAIVPGAVAESDFPAQLAAFLRDRSAAAAATARRYPSREAAVAARTRRGLSPAAARALATRGLSGDDQAGWEWRIDPRLRGASAVKLSGGQIRAVLAALRVPVLLMLAEEGPMRAYPLDELAREHVQQLRVVEVQGGHHFHMEAAMDPWVPDLLAFFEEQ
jgi:pimeloyl-ACP methyl ester carboxylesterase